MSLECAEICLLAGGRGTRMRSGVRPDFANTPKVFLRITHEGRSATLFSHAMDGIMSLNPGAVSVLASPHPACGPELIIQEMSRFHETQHVTVMWDPPRTSFGTARALYQAAQHCSLPILIVVPADTIFPFRKLLIAAKYHMADRANATWVVTTAPGPAAQNAGCLLFEGEKRRLVFSRESTFFSVDSITNVGSRLIEGTSTGVIIFSASFYRRRFRELESHFSSQSVDIYRDFMAFLLGCGHDISVFDVAEPTPDLGTPERFIRFEQAH